MKNEVKFNYKILEQLKKRNISLYSLRTDKIIAESTLQNIREGKSITLASLYKLACVMGITLKDIIEFIEVDKVKE